MVDHQQFRYPTALDLPPSQATVSRDSSGDAVPDGGCWSGMPATSSGSEPQGNESSDRPECTRGLSIDRHAFRRLRRPERGNGSRRRDEVPLGVAAAPGRRRPGSGSGLRGRGKESTPVEPRLDAGGDDEVVRLEKLLALVESGTMNLHDLAGLEEQLLSAGHVTNGADYAYGDLSFDHHGGGWLDHARENRRPSSAPHRSTWAPTTPGRHHGGGSMSRRASRSDPVKRGAQMRALWSQDLFLRAERPRKYDPRFYAGLCGRRGSSLIIPTYVPPHEKRRDSLRMHIRQQMLVPSSQVF
eukprot:gnl/TRDRNA2_/TRDRNA2_189273_c0_seq1.p1 gnl/TRDRNA2_/TRDRNA2_189273_c0~~gnl/TRDRNA2_/TRDRNA2_189273_c0_seq1.p1  ORF type:complete len:309 (+),score=30.86 gnl/TRDRNA2_/TRDRNA2_189273_c0_seq1:31-927(+)